MTLLFKSTVEGKQCVWRVCITLPQCIAPKKILYLKFSNLRKIKFLLLEENSSFSCVYLLVKPVSLAVLKTGAFENNCQSSVD